MATLLAMIITILPNGLTRINADAGRALCPVTENGPTTITEVYLSATDSAANWKDCDYGLPEDAAR